MNWAVGIVNKSWQLFLCLATLQALGEGQRSTKVLNFNVQKLKLVAEIKDEFLSFTLDSRMLFHHWKTVDLRNRKLIELTKALTPAYLRVGGTDGDNLRFCPNCECESNSTIHSVPESIITGCDISLLANFTVETGSKLIYGLNVLERKDGHWDPSNSLELFGFLDNLGVDVAGWELGNEPRRFGIVFNKTISAKRLAKDFNILKQTLTKIPRYSKSPILGPDITHIRSDMRRIRYLSNFLKELNNYTLSTATFHDYYFAGRNSTLKDFMDIKFMNKLPLRIKAVKKTVKNTFPRLPVWIGETSSGWGGGNPNISDRFVSCFMWLDKLGQSALNGIEVVIRQTLGTASTTHHDSYGLVGRQNNPTPSYFVSYIFKKLVGNQVLSTKLTHRSETLEAGGKLRLFVHCLRTNPKGIVIYGLNLDSKSYRIKIIGMRSSSQIEEYKLNAPNGNLTSRHINLNGNRMSTKPNGKPLPLIPKILKGSFQMEFKTVGFWVIKNANVSVCTNLSE